MKHLVILILFFIGCNNQNKEINLEKIKQIKIGMNLDECISILGMPRIVNCRIATRGCNNVEPDQIFEYTPSKNDNSSHIDSII